MTLVEALMSSKLCCSILLQFSLQYSSSVCSGFPLVFILFVPSCSPYYEPEDLPPADNSDPEFGLHGYSLHFVLHNTGTEIMLGHFRQLSFCTGNLITECNLVNIFSFLLRLNWLKKKINPDLKANVLTESTAGFGVNT